MKICFYNLTAGYKTGGLETYCWEVGKALVRQGHEVHIIGGIGGSPRNDEVKLIPLPYRHRATFPNLGTRFRKLMERVSFAKVALPHLIAGEYDAVIVNKPYDFPAIWRARRAGMKAVTAIRSGGTEFYAGDRFFGKAIDLWLSTSRYNADQVEGRYRHPVTVIPNGVDPEVFQPALRSGEVRVSFGIPADAQLIVSVGRLVGWKGLHLVIRALPALPGIHYLVAGDGEARPALEALAQELGVADRVHFAGEINHQHLPKLLATGDLFVQPSVGEEAFGIAVVEAMASGLPTLVSNQGGLREIVQDGVTGALLPVGDAASWQSALQGYLADPSNCRQMGIAARQRVMDRYTWAANAAELTRLINRGRGAK